MPRTIVSLKSALIGFAAGSALLLGGCTLLENPDDHFLDVPVSDECRSYCSDFLTACSSDPFNDYTNEADCHSACSGMLPGSSLDYERNTLACRVNHLEAALSIDPATHCPHASRSGGSVCVRDTPTPCETFCANFQESCTANFLALDTDGEGGSTPLFECVHLCATTDDAAMAESGAYSGNKVGCLETWTSLSQINGDEYCEEGSPATTSLCTVDSTDCDAYCDLAEERCVNELTARFVDEDGCAAACVGGDADKLKAAMDHIINDDSCDTVDGSEGPCTGADQPLCFPAEP